MSSTVVGGRQWATRLSEIRIDHTARYSFASELVDGIIIDAGCGIGYGSNIMAHNGSVLKIDAIDASSEAIDFANEHWIHPKIKFSVGDLNKGISSISDWTVAFEIVEHLKEPSLLLRSLKSERLLVSVPNQDVMPWDANRHSYHFRHYTKIQLNDMLTDCGWKVVSWYGQVGKCSRVERNVSGMTLVALCNR